MRFGEVTTPTSGGSGLSDRPDRWAYASQPVGGLEGWARTLGTGFATTVNGRISGELKDRPYPLAHELAGLLDRLDGRDRFCVSLWALPAGTSFDRVDLERWPVRYIQAAGSSERMTVEIRRDGPPAQRHAVCGWSATLETTPSIEIRWQDASKLVFSGEAFTAAEALPLFLSYLADESLPRGYTERFIDA